MTALSPFSGSPVSTQNEIDVSPIAAAMPKPFPKTKPRKRVNTAEKRHQHNAIERQRRETLNGKFLSLARLLPSLASHRRPSKSAIVNGSIAHLTYQRAQRLLAAKLLRRLCAEHDELLNEVNEWRNANDYAPKIGNPAWCEEVDAVCSVEKEVFGNFASMGADGDDDDDNDISIEMSLDEAAAAMAASFGNVNGLITPRSSSEVDPLNHAHAIFGNMPVADRGAPTCPDTIGGLNWSNDFAFSVNSTSVASTTSSLPFGNFVSDPFDQSSTGSPTNSQPGVVLTPPMTGDINVFSHSPSPRSSTASTEDKSVPQQQPHGWSAEQMLFPAQQHRQQQQAHPPQSQATAYGRLNGFLPTSMFPQPTQQQQGQNTTTDAFTQSLLASMFPQNVVTTEQVQQWRKMALGGILSQQQQGQMLNGQPSLDELKNAVRAGMGLGLGLAGVWPDGQNRPVEGL